MHFYQKHNVGYKGKKAQKTLYMCLCIWYIGDRKMKQVNVKGIIYPVESEDDLITLTHQLAREGYSVQQIASILNISERKAKKYMEDCW